MSNVHRRIFTEEEEPLLSNDNIILNTSSIHTCWVTAD